MKLWKVDNFEEVGNSQFQHILEKIDRHNLKDISLMCNCKYIRVRYQIEVNKKRPNQHIVKQ